MADDALYYDTSLILNFEDASSTTFTDISPNAHASPTVAGNAANSATQFYTGSKSLSLDGTGDWLTYPTSAEWQFGTGDYCIEFWYRPTTGTPGAENWLIMYGTDGSLAAGTNYGWLVRHTTAGKINLIVYNGSSSYTSTSTTTFASGTWYHVACTRVSGTQKVWINGVEEDSDSANVSINVPTGTPIMRIGASTTGATPTTGYIDGLRITKGQARYTENFAASLPTELFTATAPVTSDVDITVPMPTAFAGGGAGVGITAPMPTALATQGGYLAITMPMPQVDFTAHDSTGENALHISMPMPTADARLGAQTQVQAPMVTVDADVTTTILFEVQAQAPMPTLAMMVTTTGSVSVQASAPMPTASIRGGNRLAATAPMATVQAQVTGGSVISITVSAPMAEVAAELSSGGTMSVALSVPMPVAGPWGRIVAVAPMAQVTVVARSVVVVTYEAYAVNLKPGPKMPNQVTRYTNFPFNQIVRFQGRYIGVADDGLYELGGSTDYASPAPAAIAWAWRMGTTDFGSSQMKVDRQIVIGGRLGANVVASVSAGEKADVTYTYAPERGREAQNYRVKLGKGFKARYYSFGLSGTGEDGYIDTIDFDAQPNSRKV